jgi:hypothetical protein
VNRPIAVTGLKLAAACATALVLSSCDLGQPVRTAGDRAKPQANAIRHPEPDPGYEFILDPSSGFEHGPHMSCRHVGAGELECTTSPRGDDGEWLGEKGTYVTGNKVRDDALRSLLLRHGVRTYSAGPLGTGYYLGSQRVAVFDWTDDWEEVDGDVPHLRRGAWLLLPSSRNYLQAEADGVDGRIFEDPKFLAGEIASALAANSRVGPSLRPPPYRRPIAAVAKIVGGKDVRHLNISVTYKGNGQVSFDAGSSDYVHWLACPVGDRFGVDPDRRPYCWSPTAS